MGKWSFNDTGYDDGYKDGWNEALEEFADKLKSKPYWDDKHNFEAIPVDFIDEVLEGIKR